MIYGIGLGMGIVGVILLNRQVDNFRSGLVIIFLIWFGGVLAGQNM